MPHRYNTRFQAKRAAAERATAERVVAENVIRDTVIRLKIQCIISERGISTTRAFISLYKYLLTCVSFIKGFHPIRDAMNKKAHELLEDIPFEIEKLLRGTGDAEYEDCLFELEEVLEEYLAAMDQ